MLSSAELGLSVGQLRGFSSRGAAPADGGVAQRAKPHQALEPAPQRGVKKRAPRQQATGELAQHQAGDASAATLEPINSRRLERLRVRRSRHRRTRTKVNSPCVTCSSSSANRYQVGGRVTACGAKAVQRRWNRTRASR